MTVDPWRLQAPCRDADPETWFAPKNSDAETIAHTTCYTCPVKQSCAITAWEQGEEYGIWAGVRIGSEGWQKNLRKVAGIEGDYCNSCRTLIRPPGVKAADHPGATRVNATECLDCWRYRTGRRTDSVTATHCKNGHEFTDENTYVRPSGKRECRSCREGSKAAFMKKGEAAA